MNTKFKTISFLLVTFFLVTSTVYSQKRTTSTDRTDKSTTKTTVVKTTKRIPSTRVTYKTPKRKISSVRTLPKRTVIKYNNDNYFFANNRYYTYNRGRYIPVMPKIGFRTRTLPVGYVNVVFKDYNYFLVNGIFYTRYSNEYEVVEPEMGTIIYELPEDYERVVIDGNTYYEYSNILYEKIQVNGTRAYEVVGVIDL